MEILIDCAHIDGPREFHYVFAQQLHFPEWYGNNLDALHDCLTDIRERAVLTFTNWSHVAAFARGFRRCLEDAERENPHLTIKIFDYSL